MDILIQRYLKQNDLKLKDIPKHNFVDKLGIKCSEYKGYCLFKYASIISEWNPIQCQTRGIILDGEDNWKVVNFPFEKFFNMGEVQAHEIDWHSAEVYEKLDGSIIYVWWAERLQKWMFSSSGTCNAYDAQTGFNKSFGDLVRRAADNIVEFHDYTFEQLLNKKYCYMFELESMYNQIVVSQTDNEGKLTLLGARNLETLMEVPLYGQEMKEAFTDVKLIPRVYTHKVFRPELLDYVNSRPASESEGLVVVDKNFNRIKVKSKEYALAHKSKDTVMSSWRNVVEIVLSDGADDIKAMLGEVENKRIEKIESKLEDFIQEYKELLKSLPEDCRHERRSMGIYLGKNNLSHKFGSLVWNNFYGSESIESVIKDMSIPKLTDLLMEGDPEY